MIRRPFIAAALVSAVLLPLVATPSLLAQGRRPAIQRANVRPRRVENGRPVTVTVRIKPNGASISAVRGYAQLQRSSARGPVARLDPAGAPNSYSGQVTVPANTQPRPVRAFVFVEVQSSNGPVTKRVGAVTVPPGGNEGPPPAPDI